MSHPLDLGSVPTERTGQGEVGRFQHWAKIWYTPKNMKLMFGMLFRIVFAVQIGRLLPRIGRFLLKTLRLLPKSSGFIHT